MQHVHIIKGPEAADMTFPPELAPEVKMVFVPDSLHSGRSAVVLVVGEFMCAISARNFVSMAAAARGYMIESGEIPVALNPGIAIAAGKGVVHFATEAPLQNFDFTTVEAKKFWRVLREKAEESGT